MVTLAGYLLYNKLHYHLYSDGKCFECRELFLLPGVMLPLQGHGLYFIGNTQRYHNI